VLLGNVRREIEQPAAFFHIDPFVISDARGFELATFPEHFGALGFFIALQNGQHVESVHLDILR
jgi:hypothetical protein